MADEKKTVTMESIQLHTYDGQTHPVGALYELPEEYVESVIIQGKAVRADRVAHAKAQEEAAAKARESHPVGPITTDDFPHAS